jgi:hypothetical protein
MLSGDIAEGQRRPEGDARTRIIAAHDAHHVVARGVEAANDAAISVERTRMRVGLDAGCARRACACGG